MSNSELETVEFGCDQSHEEFFKGLEDLKEAVGIGGDILKVNTDDDTIVENVRQNIRRGHKQIWPYPPNDKEIAIVGGGWSLDSTIDELLELYWNGVEIIALNNSGQWLLEHNIKPAAVFMLDARESNLRFIEEPIEKCKYFIASQCHPKVFDAVEGRDVYIWHTAAVAGDAEKTVLDDYYFGNWVKVPGSSTVGFRTVCALRILGYEYLHLFGVDSCYSHSGKEHHAYPQPENDDEEVIPIGLGGKKFFLSAWQFSQALDFAAMIRIYGEAFKLSVHGDGLIAHIVNTGAEANQLIVEAGKAAAIKGDK